MADRTDLARNKASRGACRANVTKILEKIALIINTPISQLVEQNIDQLMGHKLTLSKLSDKLTQLDGTVHDELPVEELKEDYERCLEYQTQIDSTMVRINNVMDRYDKEQQAQADRANPTIPTQRQQVNDHLKLPRLELPEFNGTYSKWTSFINLFDGAVNNNNDLSNSQKLFYLKSCLKGDPQRLLSALTITDANYTVARNILFERFDNRRLIVREHLKGLIHGSTVKPSDASSLRKLMESAHEHRLALEATNIAINESIDLFIIYHIVEKLDSESLKQWELAHPGTDLQTYQQLHRFLQTRCQALEAANAFTPALPQTQVRGPIRPQFRKVDQGSSSKPQHTFNATEQRCYACKESHKVYHCDKFKSMDVDSRKEMVLQKRACLNCLQPGHFANSCPSSSRCRTCNGIHHTLLHKESKDATEQGCSSNLATAANVRSDSVHVLLQTAHVQVLDGAGKAVTCRALLDNGSQLNLISNQCRNRLRLPYQRNEIPFKAAGDHSCAAMGTCQFQIAIGAAKIDVPALVTKNDVTGILPSASFTPPKAMKKLKMADPDYSRPAKVDIIIGAQFYESLRLPGTERTGDLHFINTVFGYVASGVVSDSMVPQQSVNHIAISDVDLKRFWEIEDIQSQPITTKEERTVVQHYDTTTTRKNDGRFVVQMPIAEEKGQLGESYKHAEKRFLGQERRIHSNPSLAAKYQEFIEEFKDLGHLEPVPPDQLQKEPHKHCYLPHHAVFKESSTTTKLRVVFDGSAPTSTGISLNDTLLVGPTIQDTVFDLLMRFRLYKIGFTADIAKMYRQIELAEDARDFHRILWRNNPNDEIEHWRMTRVTYGIASSAYHSIRSLQESAKYTNDDLVKAKILKDFYVDDLLSGADSFEKAKRIQDGVNETLANCQFSLRKWISNEPKLIERLPEQLRGVEPYQVDGESQTVKTLGVIWNHIDDQFHFTVSQSDTTTVTKRHIISDCSRIFDPVGWLTPIVVKFKIWIQRTWILGVDWDDPLPKEFVAEFNSDKEDLQQLKQITLPRRASLDNPVKYELHCFSDASEKAFAGAIYLTTQTADGIRHSHLLSAKARVAPVKTISLPRLELCAAHLVTKLLRQLLHSLDTVPMPNLEIYGWSDSTITLAWISALPTKWTTFIANRVSEIQDAIPPSHWNHISSQNNPADVASRGTTATIIKNNLLWWHGPKFLALPPNQWNLQPPPVISNPPEMRKTRAQACHTISPDKTLIDINRFSSFRRLRAALAYSLRFIQNLKQKTKSSINTDDLKQAERILIQQAQVQYLAEERKALMADQCVTTSSSISNLDPIVDQDLIKVGGRLYQANLPEGVKHPIILPRQARITSLIVQYYHEKALHAGPQTTLYHIRQQFWIVSGRNFVRKVIHGCTTCRRHGKDDRHPKMGPLPAERITPAKPFTHTGIDFAGPFRTRQRSISKITHKTYICVFVCFATKAVHLETVTSLTTEACIASLKRFVARRGAPETIFTDNGTNFVGARNELVQLQSILSQRKDNSLAHFATHSGMNWVMIPPRAPNFGGLWEAAVKSAKNHLKRVIGSSILTLEQFTTLLAQVEAVLNSRPISPMSPDSKDMTPLSPGHFLIGSPLTSLPEPLSDQKLSLQKRFQLVSTIAKQFWNRWRKEYLSNLQPLTKWKEDAEKPQKDDIVLIMDDNVPALHWPRARIVELYLGNDKVPRVVKLFDGKTTFNRPVSKLRMLPKTSI